MCYHGATKAVQHLLVQFPKLDMRATIYKVLSEL